MTAKIVEGRDHTGKTKAKLLLFAIACTAFGLTTYVPFDQAFSFSGVWKTLLFWSPLGLVFLWPTLVLIQLFARDKFGRWAYCTILVAHTTLVLWWLTSEGGGRLGKAFAEDERHGYYGTTLYGIGYVCAWLGLYYQTKWYRARLLRSQADGRELDFVPARPVKQHRIS